MKTVVYWRGWNKSCDWAARGRISQIACVRAPCLWLVGCLACFGPACGGADYPGEIAVAPEGSKIAYAWVEAWYPFVLPDTPAWSQTAYLKWWNVSRPAEKPSIKLETVGRDFALDFFSHFIHLSISPDSRLVAAASPSHLNCVDLQSARHWELTPTGEFVTSMVWLSPDEIAYASHANRRGEFHTITDRSFWRQKVHSKADARVEIYRDPNVEGTLRFPGLDWPWEYWSPNGKYVVFRHLEHGGRFRLLDIEDRTSSEFGQSNSYTSGVAWKPDSSAVACFSEVVGLGGRFEALLLEPSSLGVHDFSEPFRKCFGDDPSLHARSMKESELFWTIDAQFLVINDLDLGGCLIRPNPWEFVALGKLIGEKLPLPPERPEWEHYPSLSQTPVPGWLHVYVRDRGTYAVDYDANELIRLTDVAGCWSQDGRWLFEIDYRVSGLDFERVPSGLPSARTQPATATVGSENDPD